MANKPVVLTIAGSDSGAGAGIQADLKTASALNTYCVTVITAITAQNTCGVAEIHSIPLEMIEKQFYTLLEDFNISSIKTGMLHNSQTINLVANCIHNSGIKNYVLDPVMIATSGDKLILEDTVKALTTKLFPLAKIITPNLDEAEAILNKKITNLDEMKQAAIDLLEFGSEAVLLKGGHLKLDVENKFYQKIYDILVAKNNFEPTVLESNKINTKNLHGTGCTLSAAIAAYFAKNYPFDSAILEAKNYVNKAILAGSGLNLGKGNGPLEHFF